MGAGTQAWINYEGAISNNCKRVLMTEDMVMTTTRTINHKRIYREVVAVWESQPPLMHIREDETDYKSRWKIPILSDTIYTDASIKRKKEQ